MVERASKQSLYTKKLTIRIAAYCFGIVLTLMYVWFVHNSYTLSMERWNQADAHAMPPLVYVHLGTTQLYALPGNYTSPSNLWTLTNKNHPIQPADYAPHDLVPLPLPAQPLLTGEQGKVRRSVAQALTQLDTAAKRDQVHLMINSAYRSYAVQQQLLHEQSTELYDTGGRTAPAGTSEHQLGLAVDFSTDTPDCRGGVTCAIDDGDAAWLADHAYQYGFILRYPEGREQTTGYEYEPWHYRYVGAGLSKALYEQHMVLEDAWPGLEQGQNELQRQQAGILP